MLLQLTKFIQQYNGINDKIKLAILVGEHFSCVKDRSVYYTSEFAVRFCKANSNKFNNTVLSLSVLQKYDKIPFVVCISTPKENYMLLANSTFLSKISHSSQKLRVDNIKGSFLGSDIIRRFGNIVNSPENFSVLFGIHKNNLFEENLIRLVDATNGIVPTGEKFNVLIGNRIKNVI